MSQQIDIGQIKDFPIGNVIYVDASFVEIPGKVYKTLQSAINYIGSISDGGFWSLQLANGNYTEDLDLATVINSTRICFQAAAPLIITGNDPVQLSSTTHLFSNSISALYFIGVFINSGTTSTTVFHNCSTVAYFENCTLNTGYGVIWADCAITLNFKRCYFNGTSVAGGTIPSGINCQAILERCEINAHTAPCRFSDIGVLYIKNCTQISNSPAIDLGTGASVALYDSQFTQGSNIVVQGTGIATLLNSNLNGNTIAGTVTVNAPADLSEDAELATKKYVDDSIESTTGLFPFTLFPYGEVGDDTTVTHGLGVSGVLVSAYKSIDASGWVGAENSLYWEEVDENNMLFRNMSLSTLYFKVRIRS